MMELGATGVETTSDDQFRAFVSYSHADTAIARKLHRKIENYRLPARLQDDGEPTGSDQNHGRLGKIFRDREDLPAAQDLSEAVKAALTKSEALIVICSPDAQASPWVAQEIELFRSLHPNRPILAALIRGEPAEAFPTPLLQGREPLAADLRKEGDGWRLGFLKIIAGIAGVPLDALVQRDATRRIRRVMAVTGSALVALLAMIGMTIFAIQSRNEAQHQQAEAEGLVEYMLTDLRTELKGVGRLDVMTKVNERAMDFYEGQGDLSEMPAESLERRARILHAMGEDDEKRGDLDKALAKFTEAHRVTETLLARDPENPDRIFGHAQSEYWVGRIAELKRDWVTAKSRYQSYFEGAKKLVTIDPQNPDFLMEMGWGFLNLGIVELKPRSSAPFGRENFQSAIEWMEKALEQRRDDITIQKEIGNAHAWLADSYLLSGQVKNSLAAREAELEWRIAYLATDQRNTDARYGVAKARYSIAYNQSLMGNQNQALETLRMSRRDMEQMILDDPKNANWEETMQRINNLNRRISNAN